MRLVIPTLRWSLFGMVFAVGGGMAASVASVAFSAADTVQPAVSVICRPSDASPGCYTGFTPPGAGGQFHYYASLADGAAPVAALIAVHGHPRDANVTFDAASTAMSRAGAAAGTLVVAPVFQVADGRAARCSTPGVPVAQAGDLLWTCASWLDGGASLQPDGSAGPGAFAAMDALVAELVRRWPSLRTVTVAGFSAGAQMVQHAIAFAAPAPAGVRLRYVVADPGSWLYFDPVRPQPQVAGEPVDWARCAAAPGAGEGPGAGASVDVDASAGTGAAPLPSSTATTALACMPAFVPAAPGSCAGVHRWKYGTDALPALLQPAGDTAALKARYAAADIHYLAGALDTGTGRGTFHRILDTSCAAMAQGPYRLERALAYAAYDRQVVAPQARRTLTVVPGCAHDVRCVFTSPAARQALLGTPR